MSIDQQYSRYLPIWKELKEKGRCRISAPPMFHRRIIKAVQKRKDRDTEFRYEMAEQHLFCRMKIKTEGSVITFTLHKYLTPRGL